jgi:hypothetical protein
VFTTLDDRQQRLTSRPLPPSSPWPRQPASRAQWW